ncbi:hypothetical protein D3C71_2243440 [compost metagenome]
MLPQALEHGCADFAGQRIVLGQLQVVLGLRRLVTRGHLAVEPLCLFQRLADAQNLIAGKHLRDM